MILLSVNPNEIPYNSLSKTLLKSFSIFIIVNIIICSLFSNKKNILTIKYQITKKKNIKYFSSLVEKLCLSCIHRCINILNIFLNFTLSKYYFYKFSSKKKYDPPSERERKSVELPREKYIINFTKGLFSTHLNIWNIIFSFSGILYYRHFESKIIYFFYIQKTLTVYIKQQQLSYFPPHRRENVRWSETW